MCCNVRFSLTKSSSFQTLPVHLLLFIRWCLRGVHFIRLCWINRKWDDKNRAADSNVDCFSSMILSVFCLLSSTLGNSSALLATPALFGEFGHNPGGALPYKGLNTLSLTGYLFLANFWIGYSFGLNVLKNRTIFVLNRVRVWGAGPHLPTQGYIEYPPGGNTAEIKDIPKDQYRQYIVLNLNCI